MLTVLPSFGHIVPFGAIAFLVLFWGMRERRQYPGEKYNSTTILGLVLVVLTVIYAFYSGGFYFGIIYLIISVIFAKLLNNF